MQAAAAASVLSSTPLPPPTALQPAGRSGVVSSTHRSLSLVDRGSGVVELRARLRAVVAAHFTEDQNMSIGAGIVRESVGRPIVFRPMP